MSPIHQSGRVDPVGDAIALLPQYLTMSDAGPHGKPEILTGLVQLVAEQMSVVVDDIEQAYDDLFIETCAPWVIPYIADLIGVYPGSPLESQTVLTRATVANAIRLRRRKGTITALEQVAADLMPGPASATEMFRHLVVTQNVQHPVADRGRIADVRNALNLEQLHGPFDSMAHTGEARLIKTGRGRYGPGNIAVTLWRSQPLRRTWVDAGRVTTLADSMVFDPHRFRFDPLGGDRPLAAEGTTELSVSHQAGPLNVPAPITRRAMADAADKGNLSAYYGPDGSVEVHLNGKLAAVEVPDVVICHLGDTTGGWNNVAKLTNGQVAIDPELGRLATADPQDAPPRVRWVQLAPSDTGAAELVTRSPAQPPVVTVLASGDGAAPTTVTAGLVAAGYRGTVEVGDNLRYLEDPMVSIPAGALLTLRGASGHAPVVQCSTGWTIEAGDGAVLELSHLTVSGGPITIKGKPDRIVLHHVTLVPGGNQLPNPLAAPVGPTLVLDLDDGWSTELFVDTSICGPLRLPEDGSTVEIVDSIVDGLGGQALDADGAGAPGPILTMRRSTVVGDVSVSQIDLVEDCVIDGTLTVTRRQLGCIQFSWLESGSQTPRRHKCLPIPIAAPGAGTGTTPVTAHPPFMSTQYGDPLYLRIRDVADNPNNPLRGAGDGYEMGAYARQHHIQRDDNLRRSLTEYLRFGMEVGVFDGSSK
ncbi:phage tail protein [Arthrobacter sp. B0490]|uniref:phage tail protein n=1 Tax=Arthrobacter sp. B0490 TaxID=2058891 RepID=UPI000CE4D462|nr:phage tail protein [Arthrobacter sp. B0490]